jgi:nucleotide-binding universal stress UspA family protein
MRVNRILVPIDGTEVTDRAIDASVGLAGQLGASIVGFVALPQAPPAPAWQPQGVPEGDAEEPDGITEAIARPLLARFEAVARAANVPFEGVFDRVPHIDRAIIAAAESHGCDLIIMVTHGRGAFGEFLFGSQTKAVLAGSDLPLLVLH